MLQNILTPLLHALYAAICGAGLYAAIIALTKKTTPAPARLILVAAFCAYIFLVLHQTLLSRPPVFFNVEINPFASYLRAMRAPSHLARIEVRNLVLNIAMFVPLGFMLPKLHPRLTKFYTALPIALSATLAVETTQLLTHRGVFATEDILHNFAGAVLGYLFYKAHAKTP